MQHIQSTFAASLGGDRDGTPAEKKSSGFRSRFKDDASTRSLNDSSRSSSVSHRDMEASQAVDDTYSAEERLEKQLKRIAESRSGDEEMEEEAEPEAGATFGLFSNRDRSQFHPRLTKRLMDVPQRNQQQMAFIHDPHHYTIDFHEQEEADLIEGNGGTWFECCFPEDQASGDGYAEVRNYHSPFPGQSSAINKCDLHVRAATSTVKVKFTLPIGLKHSEFVHKYGSGEGLVRIPIPGIMLKSLLAEKLKDLDWERTPYHINVFDIKATFEQSNFLVEFDKILTTPSPLQPNLLNSWSTKRGVDATAHNLVAEYDDEPGSTQIVFNPIHSGKHTGCPQDGLLYIAPKFVNGAEHPRWVNRNWNAIAEQLSQMEDGNAYHFKLPNSNKFKDYDFLTWFVLDQFKELHTRTMAAQETPTNHPDMVFDKMYSLNQSDDSAFALISKRVLDNMLAEKRDKFNQEKLLMNLEEIVLVLWPMQGMEGWFCN